MQANPRHLRSPLYALTELGREKFEQAMRLQSAWANNLAEGMSLTELEGALQLLNTLYNRLNLPLPSQGV